LQALAAAGTATGPARPAYNAAAVAELPPAVAPATFVPTKAPPEATVSADGSGGAVAAATMLPEEAMHVVDDGAVDAADEGRGGARTLTQAALGPPAAVAEEVQVGHG
jgi:hypothetical protein